MLDNKKRILIADDEVELLHTMAFTLKRKGYAVVTVQDGESAYQKISETSCHKTDFDLIITDYQMIGLSGLNFIRKIREEGISTPVLAISGFGDMNMVVKLMRAGCSDYLDKPFSINEFVDRIEKLLKLK